MSLIDVVNNLQTAILADSRCPSGLVFDFGEQALAHEDSPPRIVWVPVTTPIEAATHGGYQNALNPRSIAVRKATIAAHCWGAGTPLGTATTQQDYEAAELLETLLLCALYTQLEGIAAAVTEDSYRPDNIQYGWAFTVTFTVEIPVVMPVDPSVVLETTVINPGS